MLILVTGGSANGKSEFAENKTLELGGKKTYIATMQPFDEECQERILRHRKMRAKKHFETVERYTDIKNLDISGTALLECMSNLVANEMYSPSGAGENTVSRIVEGIKSLNEKCENLVIVTNEIFSDGLEYDSETELYMRTLGEINRAAAEMADEVYEVCCAVSDRLK